LVPVELAVRKSPTQHDATCHMHRVLIRKAMTSTLLENYVAIGVVGG
jgi:hypothetical protein